MVDAKLPVQDILCYWFGAGLDDTQALERQSNRWFAGGRALDHEIQTRFGEWLKPVAQQPLEDFSSPDMCLAAVLLLDQFSRHIYRGQASAFAFDDKALRLLRLALERGWDSRLHPVQRSFLYMPLQHAEDRQLQCQGIELYQQLVDAVRAENAPPATRHFLQQTLRYAEIHRDIIDRFGRFPHRNRVLGRTSSEAEEAYLKSASRFGQ